MLKRLLILIVLLVVAVAVVYYVVQKPGADKADKTKEGEVPKGYEKVEKGSITIVVEGTGVVEARTEARIKSDATGRVEKLLVKEGDNLVKGQVIAELDQEDQKLLLRRAVLAEDMARLRFEQTKESSLPQQLKSAEARVGSLKLDLASAEDRCGRVEALYEKDFASDQEVEDARKAVETLKLQLDEAEHTLKLLKQKDYERDLESARLSWEQAKVELAQARKALGDATIKCPIDGTVLAKYVEEGDTVISSSQGFTEGTTICTVADLTQVQVRGSVDEVDIGTVAIGQGAELTVDAYPDRVYAGTVVNVFPQGTQSPGGLTTFTVIVEVDNEDRSLLANMTASIKITTKQYEDMLLVPFAAIRPGDKPDEYVVFVRSDKGVPEKREVKLGVTDYEHYEVKEGLEEGDLVKIENFPMSANVTVNA
jgi:HlyD family secretion protein